MLPGVAKMRLQGGLVSEAINASFTDTNNDAEAMVAEICARVNVPFVQPLHLTAPNTRHHA